MAPHHHELRGDSFFADPNLDRIGTEMANISEPVPNPMPQNWCRALRLALGHVTQAPKRKTVCLASRPYWKSSGSNLIVPTIHVKLVTWAAHIYIYIKDGSSGEATPLIQHTGWGGRGRLSYLRCDSWGWG